MATEEEPPLSLIAGLPFHHTTMDEALADFQAVMRGDRQAYWVTANVDFTTRAPQDHALRDLIFQADRIFCDGLPLVWLSRWYGRPLPERVAGSDMVPKLLEISAREGYRVYFLGSDEPTLAKAAEIGQARWPGLEIAGFHAPPYAHVHEWDNATIVADINASRADLILVAVGSPKQERWISGFLSETQAKLAIGIGASLDFIAGKQTRAPHWVQRIGFEWCWRMLTDPKRLASRYFGNFRFLARAAWQQKRLLSKRFKQPATLKTGTPKVLDLQKETQLTPERLAAIVAHIRFHGSAHILVSPSMEAALRKNGIMEPMVTFESLPEPVLKRENETIVAPPQWRFPLWDAALEAAQDLQLDLTHTQFIDYPTLLRINHRKDALEKQRFGLTLLSASPPLREHIGSQGFCNLLQD